MTYRLTPFAASPLRIFTLLLCLLAGTAAADTAPPLSLRFVSEGTILPRRGHETLVLESVNIDKLDATILHVPEADTLAALQHPDSIPPEATEVWHGQIATGDGRTPPAPDQTTRTGLDALGIVKQLQPGLYIAHVHEVTTGRPRANVRRLLMITNIGIEALSGEDGIVAEARLLSEATPAINIEMALIARNNREIARVRTDGDGVVRFDRGQVSGQGEDAPAALYAYGADGEFTALAIDRPEVKPAPRAWIVTDRHAYRPGEDITGLVLLRGVDGKAIAAGKVFAQLETPTGEAAEMQPALQETGALHLHAPAAALGQAWTIAIYRADESGKQVLLGSEPITVGDAPAPADDRPQQAEPPKGEIIISPGRRSFQRGEMANISVQPPTDSDVMVALVDGSVRSVIRQHIGKDGAVLQLPIPGDAASGMYVLATAFVAPGPDGRKLHRSFGAQPIEIDEGARRMGVRLDTPEKVEAGGKLPVSVALPDGAGKSSTVTLIGTDAARPVALDPFAFFYGRRPLAVTVADSYGSVIGAPETAPSLSAILATTTPPTPFAPALIWQGPASLSGAETAKFAEIAPSLPGKEPRLRISVIASSEEKMGYAETSIEETPAAHPRHKDEQRPHIVPPAIHPSQLKPGGKLMLKPGQALIASVDPIVAAPLVYGEAGATGAETDGDQTRFILPGTPMLRDFTAGLIGPVEGDAALRAEVLAQAIQKSGLPFPRATEDKLLDAVEKDLAAKPSAFANMILFRAGRETQLELAQGLAQGEPATMLDRAARLALSDVVAMHDVEKTMLLSAIDQDTGADQESRSLALLILAMQGQPWPQAPAHALSDDAAKHPGPAATALALALAEAAHRTQGDPKLAVFDKPYATGAVRAAGSAVPVQNADTRPLYIWIVTGLPPRE